MRERELHIQKRAREEEKASGLNTHKKISSENQSIFGSRFHRMAYYLGGSHSLHSASFSLSLVLFLLCIYLVAFSPNTHRPYFEAKIDRLTCAKLSKCEQVFCAAFLSLIRYTVRDTANDT